MQRVLFKWRPSLNTGNIHSHLLLPTRHASAAILFFIHGKKSHIKAGACHSMIGETLPQKFRRGITLIFALMHAQWTYGQELEPNSVSQDTEQLFNSVNSNTPLCSVKEQLTSFSAPSRHFYSFSPPPPPLLSFFFFPSSSLSSPSPSPPQDLYLLMRC